jgi:lysophospholipase L1-like esterase
MTITNNDCILFNGDSITDADRVRSDRHSLSGYNAKIAAKLKCKCFNRAISGDTSAQMLARFDSDCRETKPSVVSILIGINDAWRRFDSGIYTSPEEFYKNYHAALVIAQNYAKKIILLEPFLVPSAPEKMHFYDDVYEKILVVRKLAREFKTTFIPLDGIFAEACVATPSEVFSLDGVHPTDAGHSLIAQEWLKRIVYENN